MTKKKALPAHEVGSGNIFADLGLPNAEEHQLKAALVVQLRRLIKARKLTQTAAAEVIGIRQPDLSNILRGHYQGFSIERLMRMLTAFDQDIEITLRPRRRKVGQAGRITFTTAHTSPRNRRAADSRFADALGARRTKAVGLVVGDEYFAIRDFRQGAPT
jgi:predicted XRE-type DNA-binding protein